jgi:hypothetical protein
MNITVKQKIVEYIKNNPRTSPSRLYTELSVSRQIIARHLKSLCIEGVLTKNGTPPKVYYSIKDENEKTINSIKFEKKIKSVIDKNYIYISPLGEIQNGTKGFIAWCQKTNQQVYKTAEEYVSTLKKYSKYKKNNLIDCTSKLFTTFNDKYIDKVFYADFYSIERFGKTKLGQLVLYAKQSQNIEFINTIIDTIQPRIDYIVKKYNIDAVAFIPPSVKREIQIMKQFKKRLKINLPQIELVKISNQIIIPQKTLSKLNDRIENASKTILVQSENTFQNILLIDDAIGSGATLHETAKQLKKLKIATNNVFAFAPVGSLKGFDVISEI